MADGDDVRFFLFAFELNEMRRSGTLVSAFNAPMRECDVNVKCWLCELDVALMRGRSDPRVN